jgi:eukaryotic-like serine/threonine-protein kinase
MIGQTLAHYQILAKIGAGGMGEVYRAHDTKLGRDVAIKVLPKELSRDPERVARFRREARTLASLQHPRIASIFGLEDVGEERLLVMELVDGEDLGQRLRRGPLPVDEALDIARQVAEGLEAAHEKGIVHRDLKPANVKVTPAGEVKILDFGLACAYQGEADESGKLDENSPTLTAAMTRAGTILGTAAYMSPEQARGKHVDRRTDVWALGCVLYEMLAGRRCFGGANVTDVLAAVVKEDPDWSCLPGPLPWRVRDLLEQALQKDPRKRLRDMGDVGLALERAQNDAADSPWTAGAPAADPAGILRQRWAWLALGLVVGGAAVGVSTRLRSNGPAVRNPLAGATITRLTDFAGDEVKAAISPDGRFVAFASDRGGEFDLLVGQVGSPDFRNVTDDGSVMAHGPIRSFGFNWDGSEIWVGHAQGGIRTTSLLGGSFRNFLDEDAVGVDWSPDGRRLLYRHGTGGDPLYVADRDGANAKLILGAPDGTHQHYPTWSADGEWIYLVRFGPSIEECLWRVRPDGSGLERLTSGLTGIASPTPIDRRTVLFCARDRNGAGPWLWTFDADTGTSQRVSFGVEQYTAIDASRDGHRLVATVADPQVALWRVPILDAVATEANAAPFPMPTVRAGGPRYGRDALFYVSSGGTGATVWRYRDGEPTEVWSGSGSGVLEDEPAVSPMGDFLALVVKKDDRRRILILSADGAERRELSTGPVAVHGGIAWSPDGRWLAAGGVEGEQAGLFKIPADGGAPTRIVDGEARAPVWSPRGDLIVFVGPQIGADVRLHAVRPDGTPVELPEIKVQFGSGGARARFLPDGRGLVYMQGLARLQDFYLLDLASMESRRLTRLDNPAEMCWFDVTPDGAEIVFDRMKQNSDIVLIELEGGSTVSSTGA